MLLINGYIENVLEIIMTICEQIPKYKLIMEDT